MSNPRDQLRRWKEYFEELLNRPAPTEPLEFPPAEVPVDISTDPPSREEIRKAAAHLKNHKVPGPDGIPPEALKAGSGTTVDMLHQLFLKIWEIGEIPRDWKHGYIITKPPKKGSLRDCENWLGISLLSMLGKVFNRILLMIMKTEVDRHLRNEQAGFRQDRSCT